MSLSDQLAKEIMEGKGEKLIDAIVYKLIADPKFARKVAEGLLGKVATKEDIEKVVGKLEELASKREVEELRRELVELEKRVATKDELKELAEKVNRLENLAASKDDLKETKIGNGHEGGIQRV